MHIGIANAIGSTHLPGAGGAPAFVPTDLGARLLQMNMFNHPATITAPSNNLEIVADQSQYGRHWVSSSTERPVYSAARGSGTFNGSKRMTHNQPYLYNTPNVETFLIAAIPDQADGRVFLGETDPATSLFGIQNAYYPYRQGSGGGDVKKNQAEAWGASFADNIFSDTFGGGDVYTGTGAEADLFEFGDTGAASGAVLRFRKNQTDFTPKTYNRSGKTNVPTQQTLGQRAIQGGYEHGANMEVFGFIAVKDITDTERTNIRNYIQEQFGTILSFASVQNRAFQNRKAVVGADRFVSHFEHIFGADTRSIRVGSLNWYYGPTGETATGNAHNIDKMIAYIDGVDDNAVQWSGSGSVTLADGLEGLLSDPLPATAFGLTHFPKGSRMWFRTNGSMAAGAYIPTENGAVRRDADGEQFCFYASGSTSISNPTATAPFTFTGVAPTQEYYCWAPMIVGQCVGEMDDDNNVPRVRVPLAKGDSIFWGLGDGIVRTGGGNGYFQLAVYNDGVDMMPSANFSKGGAKSYFYTGANTKIDFWMPYANELYENLTVNDVFDLTYAQATANLTEIWEEAKDTFNYRAIISMSILPFCGSSDDFKTLGNMTIAGGPGGIFDTGQKKDQINAFKAAAVGDLVDVNVTLTSLLDPTDQRFFASNGVTNGWIVGDGVHYAYGAGQVGGYRAQAELRAGMDSLF